jgi:hypothetical protein
LSGIIAVGIQKSGFRSQITVKWGKVALKTIALQKTRGTAVVELVSKGGRRKIDSSTSTADGRTLVTLAGKETISAGEMLVIQV